MTDEPKRAPTSPNEGMWTPPGSPDPRNVGSNPPQHQDQSRHDALDPSRQPRHQDQSRHDAPDQPQHGVPPNQPRHDAPDQPREENREGNRTASGPGRIDNRDQDPNHPANITQPRDPNAPTSFSIPPEDLMTEQEKDAAAGGPATPGNVPGVGPAPASEPTSGPVETIEDLGIGPKTPYPTGDPPPPYEDIKFGQGVKGRTDKTHATPGGGKGPIGEAPHVGDRDAAYAANRTDDDKQREEDEHRKAEDKRREDDKRKEYPL